MKEKQILESIEEMIYLNNTEMLNNIIVMFGTKSPIKEAVYSYDDVVKIAQKYGRAMSEIHIELYGNIINKIT